MFDIEEVRSFCNKYGKKRLILDTNLFLLLFTGLCDKHKIHENSATKKYCNKDYDSLVQVMRYFHSEVIVTPHVLAEISNLSRQSKNIADKKQAYYFRLLVERLKFYKEETINLSSILDIKIDLLIRFGVADVGILEIAKITDAVVATSDSGLAAYAFSQRIPCVQFETLRVKKLMGF